MKLFFRPDPFKDSDGNLVQLDDIEIVTVHTQNDEWGTEAKIWIDFIDHHYTGYDIYQSDLIIDPEKNVMKELQKDIEEYYNLKYEFDNDYKEIHKLLRSKKVNG